MYQWDMATTAERAGPKRRASSRATSGRAGTGLAQSMRSSRRRPRRSGQSGWAEIVLHSYRVRWALAHKDPLSDLGAKLARDPARRRSGLVIHGGGDPCNDPSTSEGKERFFARGTSESCSMDSRQFPQGEAPATSRGRHSTIPGR